MSGGHFSTTTTTTTSDDNDTTKGTGRSFNRSDNSLFVSVPPKSGYLQLGKDPIRLLRCDPKRNNEESCQLFDALMVQQELGWPDIVGANHSANENKDDSNDNDNDNNKQEKTNRLEPGQLVRAMLRPGGHFYNGRITHSNEEGSMCGVEFFDGDKVDALPRNLIKALVSPKKKVVVPPPPPLSPPTTTPNSGTNDADKETEPPANGASSVPSIASATTAANPTTAASPPPAATAAPPSDPLVAATTLVPAATSPSGRPTTRRGRDDKELEVIGQASDHLQEPTSRRQRNRPPRPSSARSTRPKVANVVNFEAVPQQKQHEQPEQRVAPPSQPSQPISSRGRPSDKRPQSQQKRRKRPKSANPRGRRARVREESFINKNRRLVSEMSRSIVRPSAPPPPPSEPDEDRRNTLVASAANQKRPRWRATNRVWLDATGNGMSLWSNKVQSLNTNGASRHAGPSLMRATVLSKQSPSHARGNAAGGGVGGEGTVATVATKKNKPMRSRAELIASQELIRFTKSNREKSTGGAGNATSSTTDLPLISALDVTPEDDKNIPYLLASRQRCTHAAAKGIESIDTAQPRNKWCKGGVSAEGVRTAQKRAAELIKMAKHSIKPKKGRKSTNWAQKRAAEQRLALRALFHLERNFTKIQNARQSLTQEIDVLQPESESTNKRSAASHSVSNVGNKTEHKPNPNQKKKMFTHTMSVDDEVASLVRRSKMVVLRAAMTGSGAATESVESVDFDRYALQLVMVLRRLRASLHKQGSGIAFRWRWEDLEQDLSMASKEEHRLRQHQAEKRGKQRQRKRWRQQRYNDGSAGEVVAAAEQQQQQQQQGNEEGEPPQVSINIPIDFQQNRSDAQNETNVSFSSDDPISQEGGGERANVSGPTLLRSVKRHTQLELTEHEQALLLTHFEYCPICLNSDGTIDQSSEMRFDVQEFMDAMRPPLTFHRQRVVDAIFSRFQETEEGVRIQRWRDEASGSSGRSGSSGSSGSSGRAGSSGSSPGSVVQTQLISGTEVWTAYCAFRSLTPVGHRRGHVALEALDLWLCPTPENIAAGQLAASVRSQKNLLPTVARQPLRREQWDALHRALGARIPNDDIFERVVRAAWVFVGQASIRALAGGNGFKNTDNNYNHNYNDAEDVGPFGVASDSVATFMTSVPPAVEEADKTWVKCGDGEHNITQTGNAGGREERVYWYCATTGERTWHQPISMRKKEEHDLRQESIRRKTAALNNLNSVVSHLELEIGHWTTILRREGLGLGLSESNAESKKWTTTNMLCSGAVSLRGLHLSSVSTLFIGEGGTLGCGLTTDHDVRASRTSNIVTHLWLDRNSFGESFQSVQALGHLLARVAPEIVELSLCGNDLCGNVQDAMSSFENKHFEKLLVLRLRGNKIQQWPSNMPQWNMLADLDVSDNKLTHIPASVLSSLSNLTHANFSKNELLSLPSESQKNNVVWPSTLISLDVSRNRLKKMPFSMGAASLSLVSLDLSHNSIKTLPSTLFDLKRKSMSNLQILLVQHNALVGDDSLPANLPLALNRSCRRLDVSHNSLTALPNQLGTMFELRELNASNNKIVSFPSGATAKTTNEQQFLPNLRIIKLESNKLSVLPNSFGKLLSSNAIQQCYLQDNKLVALPEMQKNTRTPTATGFVPGLLTLDVTNNNIVQLSRSIGNALGPTLLSLRIAHNRLESLPVASFACFKKLQDLTCHGNPILSPDLRDVISTGTYVPPIARQVGHVVQKIFDAIKHNWDVVDTRVHTAVKKFKRQQSTGRKRRRNNNKNNGSGTQSKEAQQEAQQNMLAKLASAQDEAINGNSLAQSTDDLLGSRRLFRSLNISYQRLRECLQRFDSSGGAHGGRLDAMEFRVAVESVGMYLSPDECDFLTAFALETCGPRQSNIHGPVGNTGCVGINEFIAEVLRPGSTSASKSEGVAQAVVRYCMDISRRKVSSRNNAYGGEKIRNQKRNEEHGRSNSPSKMSRVRQENQEMRLELQSLKISREKWHNKSIEAEQFLDGRGPKPEWMSIQAPESHAGKKNAKKEGHHRQHEETVFRAKIAHEKLRQKKRLMQQKIRQESARVRRMEMKAAADPTLLNSMKGSNNDQRGTRVGGAVGGATGVPEALRRATDHPVNRGKTGQASVPLQLKSLVASIRNSIHMDKGFQRLPKKDRLNAFFDSVQEQEVAQGLVRTTQNDDVAGGSLISSIRQMRPAVLLPPEQCPVLLNVLGCFMGGEGELVEGQYDPKDVNRIRRGRFVALFQKVSNESQKSKAVKGNKRRNAPRRPSSSGSKLLFCLFVSKSFLFLTFFLSFSLLSKHTRSSKSNN